MTLNTTHTYAILEVTSSTFDEIKAHLTEAGYEHAFHDDVIDMHGIAVRAKEEAEAPRGRLTDAELDEAFEYAHGSLRLTAALSELKGRRAGDLTDAERETLKLARGTLVYFWMRNRKEPGDEHQRALATINRLLAQGEKP